MPISKPFAIATEGATTDGRQIKREWIAQMAESYDPKAFTAIGNLEHYISVMPDSTFSAYGKVLSLSTREEEILGQKKLQLMAVFDANDQLAAFQKSGKKAFASCEVNPNFAETGKAYLTGLAFTDNPASLGTEVMEFASKAKSSPFAARKKSPDNLFTAAQEIAIEFEPETTQPSLGDTLFAKVKSLLGLEKKDSEARFTDIALAVETVATSQKSALEGFARIEKEMAALGASVKLNAEALETRKQEFATLKAELDKAPEGSKPRQTATGGNADQKTDC